MMFFILALGIATILLASYAVWVLVFIINTDWTTPNVTSQIVIPEKYIRNDFDSETRISIEEERVPEIREYAEKGMKKAIADKVVEMSGFEIEERENYPFKDLRMSLSIYLKEQDESNSRLKQGRSNYSDK